MPNRIGKYTIELNTVPAVCGYAAVVGKKEGEGPLSKEFDKIYEDSHLGQKSWEAAESMLLNNAITTAIGKAGITNEAVDMIFSGDLLDQSIASTFGVKDLNLPHIGVYGACSTMALSISMAAIFVDSNAANVAVSATSSHFCSAERQFRFPLEYGGKRAPTSQWTVTGSGCAVIAKEGAGPFVKAITFGEIIDYGIKDSNNMGAAMAPATCETIKKFFTDTNTGPDNYDLILTGDLGQVGSKLLYQLLMKDNYDIKQKHNDCALMIYNMDDKDVGAGGSGCGCSGTVLCSHIFNRMRNNELNNVLFCATGALMSPTSTQQGQSIPGIAHLVHFVNNR